MFWLFQSLLLVFCLSPGNAVSQSSSTPLIVNGVLGESVTLHPKFPAKETVEAITWLYNGKSITFIKASGTGSPLIQVTDPKRRERMNFTQSYSLQLSNLTMADTGSYGAQITTETSTFLSTYILKIFRQLRNMQVTNDTQLSENRTCKIHLTCSVENPNDIVSLRWQVSENTSVCEPNLTIFWTPENSSEQSYTCIAENPVSNLSFSVSAQRLCEGVKINKLPDTRWIMIVVPVICIVIIVSFLIWRKRRGSLHLSTQQTQGPEFTRNVEYSSVSPENTVYAWVTHPNKDMEIPRRMKNDDSVTIYSTVNHSKESKPIYPRATALDNVM